MSELIELLVNGKRYEVDVDGETPLLFVLRNDLGLKGPKLGCSLEQCNSCKVLVDGADVPSCQTPIKQVQGLEITTIEGLGSPDELHPLQEAFLEEQAVQCGYCTAGMIIGAQGLLNRVRYPSDDEIREALHENLCRCGVYERVRRAIKLRIGRPIWDPIYDLQPQDVLPASSDSSQLPVSIQKTSQLDAWIQINQDETLTIYSGKVELGQGIMTALVQIAAEELDVATSRIQIVNGDTGRTPDEGATVGSMSVEMSGNALRVASAEARHLLLALAFEELESQTPATELQVVDGTVTDPATGRQTTYWDLMGGKQFGHEITGVAKPKTPDQHKIVGQPEKRIDLLHKVTGIASYVHDLDFPGMLHGRIVRPPNYHARLKSIDVDAVGQMPGVVEIVRDGSYLGVLAEREEQAIAAMDALGEAATWEQEESLYTEKSIYDHLLGADSESRLVINGGLVDDPIPDIQASSDAMITLEASYYRPYHMHASLGPSAAAALFDGEQLTVWSHTQAAFNLQAAIADVLKIDSEKIRVIHTEGAGCYGHNGADDAGLDAALLARAVPGKHVLLKWTREEEHGWEPYSSAMVMKTNASVNADGEIIDWNYDVWSHIHSTRSRPGTAESGLLSSWYLENPMPQITPRLVPSLHFGGHRNADPLYAFKKKRVVRHFVPDNILRVSAMRSLGAYANIFAIESFMDELAVAAGVDPVEFRLRHLQDERARAVIRAAAEKAGWTPRSIPAGDGHGWGIAFAQYKNKQSYAAIVVDLIVNLETGDIHMQHVVIAADSGQVVNPDGLSNQLEGGFVQAASWTLHEAVQFDENGITSLDWDTYPILRFKEMPVIDTVILNRPDQPFMGSGEATQNPAPAAIANAIYDAVGVRLREIPFTPERVLAAIREMG